jgi:putative zinc finger/helix-turn-helix YgiT family protein
MMDEKMPCPLCEQARDAEVVERDETVTIKGKEVTFPAHFYRCLRCGEEFETSEQLDANLLAAREAFKALCESISPEALRELRAGYGASQKAFGLILGFGELTINTYEQGGVPTEPNRNLLRLAQDPRVFRMLYEANKDKIGALQRKRIEASAAFHRAAQWAGLEGLYDTLSEEERKTVEETASAREMTIPRLVDSCLLPSLNREKLTRG